MGPDLCGGLARAAEQHLLIPHASVLPAGLRLNRFTKGRDNVQFSFLPGYFVQDAGDIILTGHALGSWEFLLHHALVVWCFLYALYTHLYVAGAVIALFVEVNSVTLHLRLMLKLASAQSSSMYQLNKFANLFTYIMFRLSTQFYLTWYIIHNYSWLDHGGFFLVTMVMMNIMILIYFYRLLRADFFPKRISYTGHNGIHNNNSKKFLSD
ncbi:TLC domain-containing protein 1 isoform X3 [Echeneis naucrates]|uniref:TLC domain-containing protein 1 isoform X3 n=1 Tax=Echeneis naucrates TaxID=173247 RepID=UPI001113E35A|nr:calfacilitin isoform X3 [Echeneis naucrates]